MRLHNFFNKVFFGFVSSTLLAVSICKAQPKTIPTLHEIIDSALEQDQGIVNQRLDIQLTEIGIQQLKEAYLPRVSMTAADAFLLTSIDVKTPLIEIPQLNIKTTEGHNRFTSISNLVTAGFGSSALLYSGGKIPKLKAALSEKENGQSAVIEKSRQEIIYDISATYDQLALLAQVRAVLYESEKRLAENRRTADKTLEYGLITPYEHQKIEVAQSQLVSKILDYESKRGLVIEKLFLLTKIDKERLLLINNKLELLAVDTQQNNIENRSEIKAFNAFISAADWKIKAEKTWLIPKVEATASLGYLGLLAGHLSSSQPVIAGGEKLSSSTPNINALPMLRIGVGMKWNLFDGYEGKWAARKATLEKLKLENQKEEVLKNLKLNLTRYRNDYKLAYSQVILSTTLRQTAWNALTQANKEYKTGLINSGQLIDAEEDFQQAALGYIQAIYNQRRMALSLLQATGNLTIEVIQE